MSAIINPIAYVFGIILNGVFQIFQNVGVSIIIFTIIIYILMIPLTYKQQKFSKLSAKMQPELQAIQAKYKNKRDQASMTKMNEEMQIVYKKYGVSPSGSCLQLLIQLPVLLALYRVVSNIPQYVPAVAQNEAFNYFLGANVSLSPMDYIKGGGMGLFALIVPFLAWLTQWLNTLFMPQPETGNGSNMMKSMNLIMPLMSAMICLSLPIGLGIYWITGAVVRSIQQVIINKRMNKMDWDAMIEKNMEKYNVKKASSKSASSSASDSGISALASMRTSTITARTSVSQVSEEKRDEAIAKLEEYNRKHAKEGGIAAKANLVKEYNERNSSNDEKRSLKKNSKKKDKSKDNESLSEDVNSDASMSTDPEQDSAANGPSNEDEKLAAGETSN
ncbi:MAG: YidC/Oxa1 family membrane protein insertase [Lachnospiraceae bacterium]|nr:YidC/Oxa1 family membrane protein insertase [Lachnospiraceae bacterium]